MVERNGDVGAFEGSGGEGAAGGPGDGFARVGEGGGFLVRAVMVMAMAGEGVEAANSGAVDDKADGGEKGHD